MKYKIEFTGSVVVKATNLSEATAHFLRDNQGDFSKLKIVTCPLTKPFTRAEDDLLKITPLERNGAIEDWSTIEVS